MQPLRKRLAVSTLRQQLYGIAKQWVLCGKSGSFTLQNSRFCNAEAQLSLLKRIIFTKLRGRLHETWIK